MGMDVGTKKKGGLNSQINVTPMADVMLVLLIIIMLIAPLLQKGVDVTLPEAGNTTDKPENDSQTVVGLTANGRLFVDNLPVVETELLVRVQTALNRKIERIVLIKADVDTQYSAVMTVLDQLQRAGIEDIGLITERKLGGGQVGGN
jgi:biopolymer transport protein ExbD